MELKLAQSPILKLLRERRLYKLCGNSRNSPQFKTKRCSREKLLRSISSVRQVSCFTSLIISITRDVKLLHKFNNGISLSTPSMLNSHTLFELLLYCITIGDLQSSIHLSVRNFATRVEKTCAQHLPSQWSLDMDGESLLPSRVGLVGPFQTQNLLETLQSKQNIFSGEEMIIFMCNKGVAIKNCLPFMFFLVAYEASQHTCCQRPTATVDATSFIRVVTRMQFPLVVFIPFKVSKNSCHNVGSTRHKSSRTSKYFLPASSSRSFLTIISLLWTSSRHNQTLFSKCFSICSSLKIILATVVFPKPPMPTMGMVHRSISSLMVNIFSFISATSLSLPTTLEATTTESVSRIGSICRGGTISDWRPSNSLKHLEPLFNNLIFNLSSFSIMNESLDQGYIFCQYFKIFLAVPQTFDLLNSERKQLFKHNLNSCTNYRISHRWFCSLTKSSSSAPKSSLVTRKMNGSNDSNNTKNIVYD
ncbi:hypothetical protein H5410_053273 [Solanum commersonii]|uniref:Uncharacterized protein n=1 Tax=Solanum commersonii TaxID=4109 RepID=A0A9J5X5Y2_SOLCO|nr:hypothetical protein H5410_053273 [Solanum commersonii]